MAKSSRPPLPVVATIPASSGVACNRRYNVAQIPTDAIGEEEDIADACRRLLTGMCRMKSRGSRTT